MALTTLRYGETSATPLLIAHGLFGSARNWGVMCRRLSDTRPVIAVDMRNHGSSPWHDSHSYDDLAGDLAETILAETDGKAHVLGHSMGGKAAMVLALRYPERVDRLIVGDIAPVTYGHSQLPNVQALQAVDLGRVTQRSDAAAQLSHLDPEIVPFLLQSLDIKNKSWRLNLEVLAAEMPRIMSFPEVSGRFDGPVLMLSGAASDYVQPAHRERIRTLFPRAKFAKIPGAAHWLHADKPRETEAAVRAFLGA